MPKANSNGQGVNRYKYSSKEYETESGLNLYDFEARMHDPATSLFRTTDPKAGDYPWLNPYLYCAANPIANIDPTGEDWYRTQDDETGEYVYKYTQLTSQKLLDEAQIKGEYVGKIVVVMAGSMNEKLGKNNKLDGEGAVSARVTVYGENGPDDIGEYIGFSLTADFEKFGAIADGEYNVLYDEKGMGKPYDSHYAINGRSPVDCINGINPSPVEYNPYSDTQKNGVFIHRTNNDGTVVDNPTKHVTVSSGCILILASQWSAFENQIGKNNFIFILNRTQ